MGSLGQFKSAFGEGIRPNLFEVTTGGVALGNPDQRFLIKAASLPSVSLGTISVPYRGREIKRVGDRTFTDWSITVIADEDKAIHEAFINWSAAFMSLSDTDRGLAYGDWKVQPIKPDGTPAGTIVTLVDCWPIEVGTIDLSYDTTDSIAEFTVSIGFDHWKLGEGQSD